MIRIKFSLWAILLFPTINCLGQVTTGETHVNIISNDQAKSNSGAFDNVCSVDLYTGTANIGIPIFDYSLDGLSLGVSIGYNTKGIKVDQVASPVGLGWELYAGGYITRTVNGIEDEVTLPALGPYVNNHPTVPSTRGAWCEYCDQNVCGTADVVGETSMDLFEAHFGGRTVTFARHAYSLSGDGYNKTIPRNVSVEYLYNGVDHGQIPTWGNRIPSDANGEIGPLNSNYISILT